MVCPTREQWKMWETILATDNTTSKQGSSSNWNVTLPNLIVLRLWVFIFYYRTSEKNNNGKSVLVCLYECTYVYSPKLVGLSTSSCYVQNALYRLQFQYPCCLKHDAHSDSSALIRFLFRCYCHFRFQVYAFVDDKFNYWKHCARWKVQFRKRLRMRMKFQLQMHFRYKTETDIELCKFGVLVVYMNTCNAVICCLFVWLLQWRDLNATGAGVTLGKVQPHLYVYQWRR